MSFELSVVGFDAITVGCMTIHFVIAHFDLGRIMEEAERFGFDIVDVSALTRLIRQA